MKRRMCAHRVETTPRACWRDLSTLRPRDLLLKVSETLHAGVGDGGSGGAWDGRTRQGRAFANEGDADYSTSEAGTSTSGCNCQTEVERLDRHKKVLPAAQGEAGEAGDCVPGKAGPAM